MREPEVRSLLKVCVVQDSKRKERLEVDSRATNAAKDGPCYPGRTDDIVEAEAAWMSDSIDNTRIR